MRLIDQMLGDSFRVINKDKLYNYQKFQYKLENEQE